VRPVLVLAEPDRRRRRQQHERPEAVARLREQQVVEVGERDDQPDAVLADEVLQGGQIPRIVDARDDRALVRVVDRGRQRIRVDGDRVCPRTPERGHDVDALAGTREQHWGHDRRG